MAPETHEALITFLHQLAPTQPWGEVEDEYRKRTFNELDIAAARLHRSHRDEIFNAAIETVRITFGQVIAEHVREAAIERQREYVAND
jgi:hypothetical protein